MGSETKVSVIIPSYNHAHYIREAIESVLSQTYKNIEIVVIDDGSTDNTKEVLSPYIKNQRIHYICQENRGLSAARNAGLKAAQGQCIKFLDSDDFLYPEQIERQVAQISTGDNLISISNFCLLRPNGEMLKLKYCPADDEYQQLAYLIEVNQVPPHTLLIPKAIIQKVGGFDETLSGCADWDLWIRILQDGVVIKHLPYTGCCYRILMSSMSADIKEMFVEKCKVIEKVNIWLLNQINLSSYKERRYEIEATLKINKKLFEECLARRISFEDVLSNTLRVTDQLFRTQKSGIFKILYKLIGTKTYIRLLYFYNVLLKKNYKFNLLHIENLWKFGETTRDYWELSHRNKLKHFVFLRKLMPGDGWGGTEAVIMDWFTRIDYQQRKVTLVVPRGSKEKFSHRIQVNSWPVNIIEYDFPPYWLTSGWHRFTRLRWFLNTLKPAKIIFVSGWYIDFRFSDILAGFLSARGNIVMHENVGPGVPPEKSSKKHFGVIPGLALWWHKHTFPIYAKAYFCKKILFVSDDIRKKYIDLWGYPKYNSLVMHHGTEVSRFAPSTDIRAAMRKEYGLADTDIAIIATARLAQFKRLDRLIDAFDRASRDYKNIRLFLVGTGPLEQELKQLAESKASHNGIRFLGHVDNVPDLLRMSDIYVLSSDNEGLSLALMEAMASGLICISTKCPGSGEIIKDGVNGFLVEKNSEAVYDGLMKTLRLSPAERARMSESARKTVLEEFDVNRNVEKVLKIFGVPYKNKNAS